MCKNEHLNGRQYLYLGPDTARSFSAWSTVKYTGNNTEELLADLALGKVVENLAGAGPKEFRGEWN